MREKESKYPLQSLKFDVELAIDTESGGQLISGNIKSFT